MAQIVKLRRSAVTGKKPTNAQLELGELSINTTDGKVYFAKSGSIGPSIEELVSTNTVNTGSIAITDNVSASFFTGSFIGDGSGLYNVPASGVTGLQLNKIGSGSVTASISPDFGFSVNTNTSITGSLYVSGGSLNGDGVGLYNIPASGITGLQLNQIGDGTATASISQTNGFNVNTDSAITGSLTVNGNITVTGSVNLSTDLVLSGSILDIYNSKGQPNYFLTSDGTNAFWAPSGGKIYFVTESFVPQTTWSFVHNLGEKYPIINVYDSNGGHVIPSSIEAIDENTIIITFSGAFSGYASATIGGLFQTFDITSPSTVWTIQHNFGEESPFVQVFDANDNVILPSEIQSINNSVSTLTINFGANPQTGKVSVAASGTSYKKTFTTPTSVWTINHNLNESYPIVQAYNLNDQVIIPYDVTTIDANTIQVSFTSNQTGTIHVTIGGSNTTPTVDNTYDGYVLATDGYSSYWKGGILSGSAGIQDLGFAITGSNLFTDTQTFSGSLIPAVDNVYDIGTPSKQWRHVYISTGSLYINGIEILSLNSDKQLRIGGTQIFNTTASTGITSGNTFNDKLTLKGDLTIINTGSAVLSKNGVESKVVSGSSVIVDLGSYNSANFDYVVMNGMNMRAGNIAAVWNGSNSSHNELNTTDLGNTSPVSFNVSNDGKLSVVVSSGTWTVQINYRALGNFI